MKFKNLFLVVMIALLVSPIFADDKISAWAYIQTQSEWTKHFQTFSLGTSRIDIDGKVVKGISYHLEGQVSPSIQLIHACFSFNLFENHRIVIGQQSIPFKFYSPPPDTKYTVIYPLGSLIPTFDDSGISIWGKAGPASYAFLFLNGKGANYRDDNKDKDLVAFVNFQLIKQLKLTGYWQGGWQDWTRQIKQRNYREGMWLQAQIEPFSGLTIIPTWIKRDDRTESKDIIYQEEGWYVLGMCDITEKLKVLIQYLKDTNKETEWTIGTILKRNSRMRILLNGVIRKTLDGRTDFGLYLMTQINIGKDL